MECTKRVCCLVALLSHTNVGAACDVVQLSEPETGKTIASARPTLRWHVDDPAQVTRVQVLSYIPEGGVIRTIDVATDQSSFTPTQALTSSTGAVKVLLTQGCASAGHEDLLAQPVTFFIDTALGCEAPGQGEVIRHEGLVIARWAPSAKASSYELKTLEPSPEGGRSVVVDTVSIGLDPPPPGSLLKVRSLCEGGRSDWLRIALD